MLFLEHEDATADDHSPTRQVTTSTKRTLYFGPSGLLHLPHVCIADFSDESSYVSGIFFDTSTIREYGVSTIGVQLQRQPIDGGNSGVNDYSAQSQVVVLPSKKGFEPGDFALTHQDDTWLTKAHLRDVMWLKVQKIGPRCVGLQIRRTDHSIDILGQWDPSSTATIKTLLNDENDEGVLESITFVYSDAKEPHERYVRDIIVNDGQIHEYPSFRWDKLNEVWLATFLSQKPQS